MRVKTELSINIRKTECMVVSRKSQLPEYRLRIDSESIKQVDKFNYLGTWRLSDGKCNQDLRSRIDMAEEVFQRIKPIWQIKSFQWRWEIVLGIVTFILFWCMVQSAPNISTKMKKCIEVIGVCFCRWMLGISWMSYMTNEGVLEWANMTRRLLGKKKKR